SAFDSFCAGVRRGRFEHVGGRDDLVRLLAVITARKAADLVDRRHRRKRGGSRVAAEADLTDGVGGSDGFHLDRLVGPGSDPALLALVDEAFEGLLAMLDDDTLRQIALGKLAGATDRELADGLGCSRRTVVNKLRLIRLTW